jgi:hypothetical protein
MTTRRNFLDTAGRSVLAGLSGAPFVFAGPQPPPASERRLRLAVLTTEWRYHSHAWHMAERFLAGYPTGGRWHQPRLQVVSAYVDQFPENDLSRQSLGSQFTAVWPTPCGAELTSWRSMPCC